VDTHKHTFADNDFKKPGMQKALLHGLKSFAVLCHPQDFNLILYKLCGISVDNDFNLVAWKISSMHCRKGKIDC